MVDDAVAKAVADCRLNRLESALRSRRAVLQALQLEKCVCDNSKPNIMLLNTSSQSFHAFIISVLAAEEGGLGGFHDRLQAGYRTAFRAIMKPALASFLSASTDIISMKRMRRSV